MSAKTYLVYLQTPLGKREGKLTAKKNGDELNGWLEVLKHKEPFEGTVDENGNCRIFGELVTLMRRVPYIATGQISASAVHLKVKGERNVFELSGVACLESEE